MRRLGPYELLRKIGSGGMAEVWMGRRPAIGGASKAVAIKLLAPHIAEDPSYRQMFIDEARLSMLLTNSNVVQVFDVGEVAGECFMVMEWVDGLNLAELSRNMLAKGESPTLELTAHVMGEVLRGLAYAHSLHHDGGAATIVHRDVSPQNVLCSVSGEVKLADFGVARLAREETSGLHVKGKLRYMAPEQLRGRSREPTVDLYAVGAMLHELLSGDKFRKTRDEADLYAMALSGEYPPLPASVPAELASVCKRLLEPDATLRIQTAEAALELLGRWPGYRNNAIELGRLVREYSGISGPRSGIVHFPQSAPAPAPSEPATGASAPTLSAGVNSVDKTLLERGEPSVQTGTPTEIVAPRESGPLTDQGATAETRTWTNSASAEPTRPELPVHIQARAKSEPSPEARSSSIWMTIAAVLALAFGVFGLGVGLQWWGPRASKTAVADDVGPPVIAADEAGEGTTPLKRVEPGSTSTSTTGAELDTTGPEPAATGGDATGGETPGSDATGGETTGGETTGGETTGGETTGGGTTKRSQDAIDRKPVDATPAEVEFLVGEFTFIYVRVAGRVVALEPKAKLELKPGRHKVELRKDPNGEWLKAGTIKVEAGKRYKARMTKPAGVKLEPLG